METPGNDTNARTLLQIGLAVTSTSTPALNGTYVCSGLALSAIQAEMDSLTRNSGTFVDGTTTVSWPDKTGAAHSFTVAQFGSLINAVNLFVVQCYMYAAGLSATQPPTSATIP